MTRVPHLAVAVALAFLGLQSAAFAKSTESFEKTVPFDTGGHFSIENQNGSITIETWSQASVRIEAEKVARDEASLDDIEIDVEGSGSHVSVTTIHHRRWHGGGAVNYRIQLPADANVEAKTANGAVNITGIHGEIDAHSVNGELELDDITGAIEAETTNGSIRARYRKATEASHRFETTNGSIRIYLPSDAGGDLEVETVNGSIQVDFPTTVTQWNRHRFKGSFGEGGGSYAVETVNGSVKILEAS